MSGSGPAAATLRFAEEVSSSDPVAVAGARTRWQVGGALDPSARVVQAPSGMLEYRPEEMLVRVLAGTPVAELHHELAASRQRTAIPQRGGTVGGALAVGENDLSVLGRGRVRDVMMQVRYVSADGSVVTGGAPTVKNVTGFDLPRLLIGSLGTLGFIAEAVLRTNPIPQAACWLAAEHADPFAVLSAAVQPSAVLWDGATTWVEVEGHQADIERQRRTLAQMGQWAETESPPVLPPHRWSLASSQLRTLDLDVTGKFVASVGVGTLFASHPQPTQSPQASQCDLSRRIKEQFDPAGRLNPGRDVLRREEWI